jgi:rhodanese-related sulfurtransferase
MTVASFDTSAAPSHLLRACRERSRTAGRAGWLLLAAVLAGCNTVGISRAEGGFAQVNPSIAHQMLLDNRQIAVIDVRPTAEYEGPLGHIAGAISAPFDSIELHLPELLLYQTTTVLVYGATPDEGKRAARLLVASGFRNVVHIDGGLEKWIEKGYRTVTSH